MSRNVQNHIRAVISADFTLMIEPDQFDKFVSRIYSEGLGDWCVLDSAESCVFPLQLTDIETNVQYKIGKRQIKKALQKVWIDIPYALDTTAGFVIQVDKLSNEDIDMIIQVSIFSNIIYKWVWRN